MSRETPTEGPLARAFAIIDFVATQRGGATIGEVAAGAGLPLPTAHRLIGSLRDQGILSRAIGSKKLEIGPRMLDIGARAMCAAFRSPGRRAILDELARRLGEQCELGVVRDDRILYVDSVRPKGMSGLHFDLGAQAPLHCTSTGKLFMSRRSVGPRTRLVRSLPLEPYTDHTIVDPDRLLADLAETRRRGWALSDQEFMLGVVGCAVPVFGASGKFVAALGVSAPVARVRLVDLEAFVPAMREAAGRLEVTLAAAEADDDGAPGSAARPAPTPGQSRSSAP